MRIDKSCKNEPVRLGVAGLLGKIKNAHNKVATFTLEVRFPTSQRPLIGLNPVTVWFWPLQTLLHSGFPIIARVFPVDNSFHR